MSMTKHTKSYLFPFLLAIIVVGVVFGVILVQAQKTQQTQSKASYNVIAECQSLCSNIPAQAFTSSNGLGSCKAKCSKIRTLTCKQFCGVVSAVANERCVNQCQLIKNPCASDGDVCRVTQTPQISAWAGSCTAQCRAVLKKDKTCDKAFATNSVFNGLKSLGGGLGMQALNMMVANCRSAFE